MSMWRFGTGSTVIAKKGKASGLYHHKAMPFKNAKEIGKAKPYSSMHGQVPKKFKIKRPEGVYEVGLVYDWDVDQFVAGVKKDPLPPTSKFERISQIKWLKVFVQRLIVPESHTAEIEVSISALKNYSGKTDPAPKITMSGVVRTGHWLTGSWTETTFTPEIHSVSNKVRHV
ncbi:MAG: hypothetical protein AAFX62_04040 [Pseudomonadota bacterium]